MKFNFFIASCLFALSSTVTAEAPPRQYIDTKNVEATHYSNAFGVSLEDAKYRLSIQGEIGELQSLLLLQEKEEFAGLYVQNEPAYKIFILFKHHKGEKDKRKLNGKLNRLLAKTSWRSFVKLRKVKLSLRDLKNIQLQTRSLLTQIDIKADLHLNIEQNRVEIAVENESEFMQALIDGSLELSQDVFVREIGSLSSPTTYVNGGMRVSGQTGPCTTGFTVTSAFGKDGVVTAGHCANVLRLYNDGTNPIIPFVGEILEGKADLQWHETGSLASFNDVYVGNSSWEVINGYVPHSAQYPGNFVCKYGITTGYECGHIYDTHGSPGSLTYLPMANPQDEFVYVHNSQGIDISSGGDSGGPWFSNNKAYGIMQSEAQSYTLSGYVDAVYTPIDRISDLGLQLNTIPPPLQ